MPPPTEDRTSLSQGAPDYVGCDCTLPSPLIPVEQITAPRIDAAACVEKAVTLAINQHTLQFEVDDLTPTGKPRARPVYTCVLKSKSLGKSREIRKTSRHELESAVNVQVEKWNRQVTNEVSQSICEQLTLREADRLQSLNTVLEHGLAHPVQFSWKSYIDTSTFPPFEFREYVEASSPPKRLLPTEPRKPRQNLVEFFVQPLWRRKLKRHEELLTAWRSECKKAALRYKAEREAWKKESKARKTRYAKEKRLARDEYEKARESFQHAQTLRNRNLEHFQRCLRAGNSSAIQQYVGACLEQRTQVPYFPVQHHVDVDAASRTIVVNVQFPDFSDISDVCEFRFTKSTGVINEVRLKPSEMSALYDTTVKQAILRAMQDVFSITDQSAVLAVVANGWVTYLDTSDGREKTNCIISVSADRTEFAQVELTRVDASDCIKRLKGIMAGPMNEVAPVKPLMYLSREDSRFVCARNVLDQYDHLTNIAEIGWEEFEHLVRELFSKMFSTEDSEVQVTKSSSDGGVDAIAFDPDPIRGGKFVIQAKRYTNTVPVSAVRDLFGTMQHEGAAKGILVTTSSFGRDARKFAEDKPISLIDGANLVHLLEEHGYKVRIDTAAARRKDDWNPLAR